MSRVLASLLFLTGLSLVAPPAHAAVSVTIFAAPSTLVVGDQAVIKGKAVNAKPGSVVKLQHKVDGSWRSVASKKVWSARTYSFAVKPATGAHHYRVVKPRQLGQPYAQSPSVGITVTGQLSVTLSASPDTLTVGSTTTFAGKAVNAVPGSVVNLQHKVDGSWQQVATKKVWSTRTYSFVVRPDAGVHSYRVVKPRQHGQPYAVSPAVSVRAATPPPPAPALTVDSTTELDDQQRSILVLTGRVSHFSPSEILLERRWGNDGTWQTHEISAPRSDGSFEFRVTGWAYAQFRVVVPASAHSPELVSQAFASAQQPYRLPLNSKVTLSGLPDDLRAATVLLDIESGDEVTLVGSYPGNWAAGVYEPDGSFVGGIRPAYDDDTGQEQYVLRFDAKASGTYVINVASRGGSLSLWATTPKKVTATVDGPVVDVSNDFAYQTVDVEFDIPAGQAFTFRDGSSGSWDMALLDPSGAEQKPWTTAVADYYSWIYRAEMSGTYVYRFVGDAFISSTTLSVVAATEIAGTVDGPKVVANVDVPSRAVLISVEMPDGGVAAVDRDSDYLTAVTVDAVTGEPAYGTAGSRVVVVTASQQRVGTASVQVVSPLKVSATVDGNPTAVESSGPRRIVDVSFEGKAGQVVTAAVSGGASPGHLYVSNLSGPDGQPRQDLWGDMWHLPVDGTYVLRGQASGDFAGSFAVRSKEQLGLPADGTPVEFVIDEPREVIVARIPVAAGTPLDVALDQIDPSLGDDWNVGLYAPDGYWYNTWIRPGTLPRITVRQDGDVYAIVTADSDALGSVRLTATPVTP